MNNQTIIELARGNRFGIIGREAVDSLLECANAMGVAAWATSGDGVHWTIGVAA